MEDQTAVAFLRQLANEHRGYRPGQDPSEGANTSALGNAKAVRLDLTADALEEMEQPPAFRVQRIFRAPDSSPQGRGIGALSLDAPREAWNHGRNFDSAIDGAMGWLLDPDSANAIVVVTEGCSVVWAGMVDQAGRPSIVRRRQALENAGVVR